MRRGRGWRAEAARAASVRKKLYEPAVAASGGRGNPVLLGIDACSGCVRVNASLGSDLNTALARVGREETPSRELKRQSVRGLRRRQEPMTINRFPSSLRLRELFGNQRGRDRGDRLSSFFRVALPPGRDASTVGRKEIAKVAYSTHIARRHSRLEIDGVFA